MSGVEEVTRNLADWAERQQAASLALAKVWAGKLEAEAKRDAPWTDRTALARAGLFGSVALEGQTIFIRISHSMEYGVFLELARDGRHAILKPVRDRNADEIIKTYRRLWE